MTTKAEVLTRIEDHKALEEAWRNLHGGSINPELLAMKAVMHTVESCHCNFVRKMMALDLIFFQETRIKAEDFQNWQAIKAEVHDIIPDVPKKLKPIPREWAPALKGVISLFGDPHNEGAE